MNRPYWQCLLASAAVAACGVGIVIVILWLLGVPFRAFMDSLLGGPS